MLSYFNFDFHIFLFDNESCETFQEFSPQRQDWRQIQLPVVSSVAFFSLLPQWQLFHVQLSEGAFLLHYSSDHRPSGLLVSFNLWHKQHIKGNISLVLMHSDIVNGHRLLCDAHTVLNHIGELQLFSFLLTIVLFHFSWVPLQFVCII